MEKSYRCASFTRANSNILEQRRLTTTKVYEVGGCTYPRAHSYHSECLGLVDCRQPGADSAESASWTASWGQRKTLGQQVIGGTTREHLQRSEYTMPMSPESSGGRSAGRRRTCGVSGRYLWRRVLRHAREGNRRGRNEKKRSFVASRPP